MLVSASVPSYKSNCLSSWSTLTIAHVGAHALIFLLVRRRHHNAHRVAKHAAQAVVDVFCRQPLRPELLYAPSQRRCSGAAGRHAWMRMLGSRVLTSQPLPACVHTTDVPVNINMASMIHQPLGSRSIICGCSNKPCPCGCPHGLDDTAAARRLQRTLRMREGAQRDCRHLDCAHSSAYSRLSCMPCRRRRQQPSM